ncbi:MAG: type B diterpene cyclase [Chloroflexota bacterium]|nr:hypothetical protein [Ardenticatenaceae bacterium]GIK56305.1 MAG: type B diterpene cyclase [Chloroflexota bacterium]
MKLKNDLYNEFGQMGLVSPEAYSTAWVAMVPDADDLSRPAWPQALEYLRLHQLADGGWGEPAIYFAHERLIATLAAILAFATWNEPADAGYIARGLEAVHRYAEYLLSEFESPTGFELLLPALLTRLEPFGLDLPSGLWSEELRQVTARKMSLIGKLEIDYTRPRSWWFSMEALPEERLAEIDERILNRHGSIVTSTATTAAYLRALRQHGRDSAHAAAFLAHVLKLGGGAVGFCWPVEVFELVWVLDTFRRAGFSPTDREIALLIKELAVVYDTAPMGLSSSRAFSVNDCDDTAIGYLVLRWGGQNPAAQPFLNFWRTNYFSTYLDERTPSVSTNVHALAALRANLASYEHKQLAIHVTNWLYEQLDRQLELYDKWHISPLYMCSHAISALVGWDDDLARRCMEYLLHKQHSNGGWGSGERPNIEETSLVVLGLGAAWEAGYLKDDIPLKLARHFLDSQRGAHPSERLWIGKTLYQPIGIIAGTIYAAKAVLAKQEAICWRRSRTFAMGDNTFTHSFTNYQGMPGFCL